MKKKTKNKKAKTNKKKTFWVYLSLAIAQKRLVMLEHNLLLNLCNNVATITKSVLHTRKKLALAWAKILYLLPAFFFSSFFFCFVLVVLVFVLDSSKRLVQQLFDFMYDLLHRATLLRCTFHLQG